MPKTREGFAPAKTHVRLSPGETVKTLRELQEMTQAELAKAAGMAQSAIAALERGTATLGAERARRLAVALKVHPAVLLFPHWDAEDVREVKEGVRRERGSLASTG